MDPRIESLKTPEACERFINNALRRNREDLASEARRKALELRAAEHEATTDAEKDCLEAVYAYEQVLDRNGGRRKRASRTWQMIERHGILRAAERAVDRTSETTGYKALLEMGLQEYAFEVVILRYPHLFSEKSVLRSRGRVEEWENSNDA